MKGIDECLVQYMSENIEYEARSQLLAVFLPDHLYRIACVALPPQEGLQSHLLRIFGSGAGRLHRSFANLLQGDDW